MAIDWMVGLMSTFSAPPLTKNKSLDDWLLQVYSSLATGDLSQTILTDEVPISSTQTLTNKSLTSPSVSDSDFLSAILSSCIITSPVLAGTITGPSVKTTLSSNDPSPYKIVTEQSAKDYIIKLQARGSGLILETGQAVQFSYFQIGTWDMSVDTTVTVAAQSPPATFTNIFFIDAVVIRESFGGGKQLYSMNASQGSIEIDYMGDDNNIILRRSAQGYTFSDVVNRGYIIIGYVV